jgi:hypothetical protein
MTAKNLAELEMSLRDLSHSDLPLQIIQAFATDLGKTKQRQMTFNAKGALVREPILYEEVEQIIDTDEDPFMLLQGDIISTDTAYFLGERLIGMKFAVVNATCDLVPERREYAALMTIKSITSTTPNAAQLLGELLKFVSTKRLYLPPLPTDPPDVLANFIDFDGIAQIRLNDLLLSRRLASLSLVGWRIYGSMLRTILVRAGASESRLRESLNNFS